MNVTAIAAMGKNRVIGTGDGIPWDLPRDRQHFRSYTTGKAMLLGRRTFMEMLGWFRDHRPIVLTSDPGFSHPRAVAVAHSVDEAVRSAVALGEDELVVSGGARVYASALPVTGEILLTEIDAEFDGTATFPNLPDEEWEAVERKAYPADRENAFALAIVRYRRRR